MKPILFISLVILLISGCSTKPSKFDYSTTDAALKEYRKGWVQIMDEGRYGAAEASYRKAVELDPNFLVGKSVLGRLTLDLDERLALETELYERKNEVKGDERLLLEVYQDLVRYTNLRDQGAPQARKVLEEAMQTAERNLGPIVHKYPRETYIKAEYIEFLHSRYGARKALDSLNALMLPEQRKNPFLIGLAAAMEAELDQFDQAVEKAKMLEEEVGDPNQPKPYAVYAYVYLQMGNLELAKENADKAHELDPLNLDASRLKERIDVLVSQSIADSTETRP